MDVELVQFRFSPYNEKARWALDLKGVAHRRRLLLPGPHFPVVRKLTGQSATPVLVVDGTAIAGSARILDEIERRWPSPPLTPADAALAQSAREIERRFDEDFTPRVRRPMLDAMLTDLGYVARTFGGGLVYRAALPMAKGLIRKGNGIDAPGALEDGRKAIGESLDFVAAGTARTGYLVGNAFTRADLTAAASLATLCAPDHPDMRRPEPMPAVLAKMVEEVAGHPAIAWTLDIYRRHRPAPLAA